MPWEVSAALQRDERRVRDCGRDLTPQPVRHGAVVSTMHDHYRNADVGEVYPYVKSVDETQQRSSGLGVRRLALGPGKALMLRRIGSTEEDVAEQTRAESPMRAHRCEYGIPHARAGNRRAIGIRPVQHQALHPLRKCCSKCDCGAATT